MSEKFTAHHTNTDKSASIGDNGKLLLGGKAKVKPPSEGVWDPILQEWKIPPSEERYLDRHARASGGSNLDISGNLLLQEVEKQHIKRVPYPPHIGKYNPITNKWIIAPRDSAFHDREKNWNGMRKRHVDLPQEHDGYFHPLRHEWISARPGTAPPRNLTAGVDLIASDGGTAKLSSKLKGYELEKKYGMYDPIRTEWVQDPSSPSLKANDYLVQKGKKKIVPGSIGNFDPIKNEWTKAPTRQERPATSGSAVGWVRRGSHVWEPTPRYY